MKIGVFGGTFDPPHTCHMQLARAARDQLELDEVLWVPAAVNPLKVGRTMSSASDRLKMVELAIRDEPGMAVSNVEISRGGKSYMVDTLRELHVARPAAYWLILGSDCLRTLPSWKQPKHLLRLCRLAVARREPIYLTAPLLDLDLEERIDWIEMEPCDMSASEIREMIQEGRSVGRWLSPDVLDYIRSKELYRT
jgi:nicotinate-nucleotide adenylyltransferase